MLQPQSVAGSPGTYPPMAEYMAITSSSDGTATGSPAAARCCMARCITPAITQHPTLSFNNMPYSGTLPVQSTSGGAVGSVSLDWASLNVRASYRGGSFPSLS